MTRDLDDALRETPNATLYILRDDLRRVLIHDRADRDAIASQLLRYRDERGEDWADIIDFERTHPIARPQVARVLGELWPPDRRRALNLVGTHRLSIA